MIEHYWLCPKCDYDVDFHQPELSVADRRSEINENKICPECNAKMCFEDYVTTSKPWEIK